MDQMSEPAPKSDETQSKGRESAAKEGFLSAFGQSQAETAASARDGRAADALEHERRAAVILDGMYQFVALLNPQGDILAPPLRAGPSRLRTFGGRRFGPRGGIGREPGQAPLASILLSEKYSDMVGGLDWRSRGNVRCTDSRCDGPAPAKGEIGSPSSGAGPRI